MIRFMRWPLLAALMLPVPAVADDLSQLMDHGRWKEARAAVEALAKTKPADARTFLLMSKVKDAFGASEEALTLAEKSVAADPKCAECHEQLAEACGSIAQKAGKLRAFGLARRLKKEAEQALALDPKQIDARQVLMEFYSQAPGIVGGDSKKAAAMAQEITGLDRQRGLFAQATLAFRDKKPQDGEALQIRAYEADSANYGARLTMARILSSDTRNTPELAIHHARAAVAIDPSRSGGYAMLAGLYAHLGRWTELDQVLAESAKQVPGNLSPMYAAGRTLLTDNKELPRAERYLRQYLNAEPEGGAPTLAHAHWRLSNVLEKQGKTPEALAELQVALSMNPDLEEAKKDLKRLKKA